MGYYTDFELTVSPEDYIELVNKLLRDEGWDAHYYLEFWGYGWSGNGKWYSYDEDMRYISSKIPDALLTLEGSGEEKGDLWVAYYKGGKGYKEEAKITFDEFDEEELK